MALLVRMVASMDRSKDIIFYGGKRLTEMSREELIKAVTVLGHQVASMHALVRTQKEITRAAIKSAA